MPNPLDALKKAQAIGADPRATEMKRGEMVGPMPQFVGSGILRGLQGLKSLFSAPVAERAPAQIHQLTPGMVQNMERLYQQAKPVFQRMQNAGAFAGSRTIDNLPRVQTMAQETLGELNPEYTAVGGEGLYNIGKRAVQGLVDPAQQAYQRIMATMGR